MPSRTPPFGRATKSLATSRKAPMQRHEGGYYIRLLARDKPGSAATIARRLAQQGISLESIVQRHAGSRPHGGDRPDKTAGPVPVILITYATTEDAKAQEEFFNSKLSSAMTMRAPQQSFARTSSRPLCIGVRSTQHNVSLRKDSLFRRR